MSGRAEGQESGRLPDGGAEGTESLAEVLASIRELVSAESRARQTPDSDLATVLVLTPQMRAEPARSGEILADGIGIRGRGQVAPILDEEALRDVINAIVREELQGELGDRISRNLRKLIRRELAQMMDEQRED